jgi:aldehyde:ferredoxin oxidoreductase
MINTLHRVLYIDLSKRSFKVEDRKDLFEKYIGGSGVAIKLLHEECPQGIDPFSPDNPIILAVGALTGAYPLASKTVAMFKSPHTGDLGESHVGGRSAIAIRMAGYGAIVIKGSSDMPVYLSIHDNIVEFKDATTIWGMSSSFTAGRIMRENEKGAGVRSIMRIGRAGENMVSYASVTTETYRHFGRLGLGAIFGSKMLKGIVVAGDNDITVTDKKGYGKLYNELYASAVDTPLMKKYHDLGTAGNILTLDKIKALPVKNLTESKLKDVENISGENIAENFLGRRVACAHCPVGCVHLATLREASDHEDYFYKTTMVGYDFELIFSLGSMIGLTDVEQMLKLIEIVEIYSVDAMSMGVVLAWATEMFERGLITTEHTDGLELKWNDGPTYIEAVKKTIEKENDFYSALAQGVSYASGIYGGKEFAMAFGKNEMPGYHTGPAGYLGFLLGARHSHLDNAGYSIDQKDLITKEVTPSEVVDTLFKEEGLRQILSSLVICFFARGIYDIDTIVKLLNTVGYDYTAEQLLEIGKEIHLEKYKYKFREGFSFDKLEIPNRIYEAPDPTSKITKEYIAEGLEYAKSQIEKL